ncbi:MAG: hypothetical protein F4169_01540 [Gammaproteobacteria bacterium]|nr:hypothetical protein [Gammaproteobacteria bacterium]MYJ87623.1 hypothetical protein [Paracoccaceae bacterium]
MAMELMSRKRFEEQLKKAGLNPTEHESDLGQVWKTDDDKFVLVPKLVGKTPDWVLDDILDRVGRLYY